MRKRPVANCKCSIGHKKKIEARCDVKVDMNLFCNVGRDCERGSDIFNLVPI